MQFLRLSMMERIGAQASLFGANVMSKVRQLGLKMPETSGGAAQNGDDARELDEVIVLEAAASKQSNSEDSTSPN